MRRHDITKLCIWTFKLPIVITRFANIYGPGQLNFSALIPDAIRSALGYTNFYPRGNGKQIRDYIFIDDVVRAFLLCPQNKNKTNGKHFILGSGKGFTVQEAISKVAEILNKKTKSKVGTKHVASPEDLLDIEFRNFVADNSSLKTAIDWSADIDLEKGIELTIENFIKHK